jgi:hypothetical protein
MMRAISAILGLSGRRLYSVDIRVRAASFSHELMQEILDLGYTKIG